MLGMHKKDNYVCGKGDALVFGTNKMLFENSPKVNKQCIHILREALKKYVSKRVYQQN